MTTIPGTNVPLCECCKDEAATHKDHALGPVCADCIPHLAKAQTLLAASGLVRCQAPKPTNP